MRANSVQYSISCCFPFYWHWTLRSQKFNGETGAFLQLAAKGMLILLEILNCNILKPEWLLGLPIEKNFITSAWIFTPEIISLSLRPNPRVHIHSNVRATRRRYFNRFPPVIYYWIPDLYAVEAAAAAATAATVRPDF